MKITDVKTVLLTGPSTDDPFLREARKRRSAAFIEIYTDTEHIGLGETYAAYAFPEVVPEIVEFFKPILLGQNVDDIQALWDRMYLCGRSWCRVGLGIAVLNGIEAALWDLKGKLENKPVYELLGGLKHKELPCYATGGPSNYPEDRLAAKIEFYLGLGFNGFKLGAGGFSPENGFTISTDPNEAADFEAKKLALVRERFGTDVNVMLDGHMDNSPSGEWDLDAAKAVLKAVEPFNLFFFEEPLPYTDPLAYAELCESTSVSVAGGEFLTGVVEWRTFVNNDAFDIGQPDASFIGGMGEFVKVAGMMEARGRKIATHAWGAGASLMQNIHAAFACGNTAILEIPPAYGGLHSEVIGDSFQMKGSMVQPPTKPGFGIVLTDEIKNRYPFVRGSGEFISVPGKILRD